MPTSNLGLVGAFGAGAASDSVQQILKQKFLEAFQRQQLELQQQREAENRRQFDVETGQRGRGLDLEQARLDASMRPKPVDPVLVHGIRGADGKPIQQFVIPQPGQQFEEYEKPPTEKPESAGSDYKQYLARVAKAKGKASADELTVDEELGSQVVRSGRRSVTSANNAGRHLRTERYVYRRSRNWASGACHGRIWRATASRKA